MFLFSQIHRFPAALKLVFATAVPPSPTYLCVYGVCSIAYDGLNSPFFVFGAYDIASDTWFSWAETVALADSLSLPTVPVVFAGILDTPDALQALLTSQAEVSLSLSFFLSLLDAQLPSVLGD